MPELRASTKRYASWGRRAGPTWIVALTVYGGFFALTWFWGQLPLVLAVGLGAVIIAWHGSLQHEATHGQLAPVRWINDLPALLPLSLWVPYPIYRTTHRAHHDFEILTDPAAWVALTALIALAALACDNTAGGQVGEETIRCGAVEVQVLGLDDSDHPLGFSPQQALDAVPETEVSARWVDEVEGLVDIALSYRGGALSYQDREWLDESTGALAEVAVAEDCLDIVAVEVAVALASDDGRLAEELTATLRVTSPGDATVYRALDGIAGDADPDALAPPGNWTEQQLSLTLVWTGGVPAGVIDGVLVAEPDGEIASAELYQLVVFGEPTFP